MSAYLREISWVILGPMVFKSHIKLAVVVPHDLEV